MRKALLAVFLVFVTLHVAKSEAIWKAKPVKEWSKMETQKFLADSPWVRSVTIQALTAGSDSWRPGPGVQLGDSTTPGGPSAGGSSPGGAPAAGGTVYRINWVSAKIWRHAVRHMNTLQGGKEVEDVEPEDAKDLAVVINGPDMKAFEGLTDEQVKAGAYLELKKSKQQVAPVAALVGRGGDNRVAYLEMHFPREANGQPLIGPDEKQVEFGLTTKYESLKTTFKLSQMVTKQGPDL